MPNLDVSEVLSDPDFATTVTVIRTTQTVGSNGRAAAAEQSFHYIDAVVTIATGEQLARLPDERRSSSGITIHTTFRLQASTDAIDADRVQWGGDEYTVGLVDDWSSFGHVAAIAGKVQLT